MSIPILVIAGSDYYSYGGAGPEDGVILSSNILCGTTFLGGNSIGNVFALDLSSSAPTVEPIPLNVQVSGVTITLGWNSVGFTLQSASSIAGPFANVLGATPPYTVVTTNSQQFFRLQAN